MFRKLINYLTIEGSKAFLFRILIYLGLYTSIAAFYSDFTNHFYHYAFSNFDVYFSYLIFPLFIIFIFLRWHKIKNASKYKNSLAQTLIFFVLALFFFLLPLNRLVSLEAGLNIRDNSLIFVYYYGQLFLAFVLLFLSVFNWNFVKKFKLEFSLITLILFLYLFSQILVEKMWSYFSYAITYSLSYILPLFTKYTYVDIETFNVRMLDFNVYIGPPCTGIYSMMAFIFLFLMTLILVAKYKRIDVFKSFFALIAALFFIFLLNIFRVVIIVVTGAFYSQELAINFFHEYLSAVFLLSLFLLYLYKIFPRLLLK